MPTEILQHLTALTSLDLQENLLTEIGDVSLPLLESLYLNNNAFDTFPSFRKLGKSLTSLNLASNNLNVNKIDLAGLELLETLSLSNTNLSAIPDIRVCTSLKELNLEGSNIQTTSPHALAYMGTRLQLLNLKSTKLTELPTVCPGNTFNLDISDTDDTLDLCSRKMAWLKQMFFNITYTDVMCSELGKMWSAVSFLELLLDPPPPSTQSPSPPKAGDVTREFYPQKCLHSQFCYSWELCLIHCFN